jgi:hypothetical protein
MAKVHDDTDCPYIYRVGIGRTMLAAEHLGSHETPSTNYVSAAWAFVLFIK